MKILIYGDESGLSKSKKCQLLLVNRGDFYRSSESTRLKRESSDALLLKKIEDVILEMPFYGYRRVSKAINVNHKKVLRIMKSNNLLCKRKKRFARTTFSDHDEKVYTNLTENLYLTGINQLWVSDITYIHLPRGFVYLSAILDAYSRKCIGWSLDKTLESKLAINALEQALSKRNIKKGLIHHSDQGVQYASKAYTEILRGNEIKISMSRKGNPYDNAKAESFFKTLKCEEVYLFDYQNMSEAKSSIEEFIENVYNKKRLHSSIGYVSPEKFEKDLTGLKI